MRARAPEPGAPARAVRRRQGAVLHHGPGRGRNAPRSAEAKPGARARAPARDLQPTGGRDRCLAPGGHVAPRPEALELPDRDGRWARGPARLRLGAPHRRSGARARGNPSLHGTRTALGRAADRGHRLVRFRRSFTRSADGQAAAAPGAEPCSGRRPRGPARLVLAAPQPARGRSTARGAHLGRRRDHVARDVLADPEPPSGVGRARA